MQIRVNKKPNTAQLNNLYEIPLTAGQYQRRTSTKGHNI
jgi:hypothetical protein